MGGGGKGGTTTQTVSIPPEVLARYNAVNARAEETAKQPFQQYSGEFVAPLTPTQTAGIQGTNAAANQAQPYYGAATGAAFAGAMPVNPGGLQVGRYMNPFTQSVVGATQAAMGQQQGQQLAQQQAESIRAGAFGGDRAGLQRQALRGQQGLAQAQAIAPLYQQGYQQALQTAQQQQGVGLGAAQANRQAVQQLSQQLSGLGTGAQQAALQGSQAQMAAGQVQQQTQQAQDTAQYQQFLQERGYPFQVAQFLANIAMGTGALSGSTTTTQQPGGFFSDKRLKKDVKEIGETHDGQPIYSYKYKGDDRTQIGLMAQDVEKRHPEAVGVMGGYKTVDYKKATEGAERTHKDMGGGLMPDGFDYSSMGGAVTSDMAGEGFERGGYVGGGLVGNDDWAQIVAANKQALGVYGGAQPMGGGNPGAMGGLNIPTSMATPKLITAGAAPKQQPSGMSNAMQTGKDIASIYKGGKEALLGSATDKSPGLIGGGGSTSGKSVFGEIKDWWDKPSAAYGGLVVPRYGYADGGETDNEVVPYDPAETTLGEDPMKDVLASGSKKYEMLKPGQTPGGGGGSSPFGDVVKGIGTVASLASLFSDERLKDNVRPVGKTFDGQNIYSYNIGEGPTQMGLMAQEVLDRKPEAVGRRGEYLTVDYDRATEDATPYAYGGLVPRQGYATRGGTDVPEEIPAQATEVPAEQPVDDRLDRTLGALRRIESGGRYDITGPASRKGDRPYGAYQVMGANVPSWTEAALGRRMTPEEFLKDEKAQDATARHRAGLYLKQYDDPRQVASMWLSGKPMEKAGNAADVLGTNVPKYLSMFDRYYGGQDLAPAGRQPGLKPPVDVGGATPTGAGEKKGFGDIITSEGFVVPALGFLGSMLASDKRNLGQALGEGIMGGVGAYQQQRKEIPATAKVVEETRAMSQKTDLELVDRLLKFNQVRVARGQPPITSLDEFKKKLADGSIIETPSQAGQAGQAGQAQPPAAPQPGAAQPAAGAPSISTANDATERTLASPPVQQAMSQINWNNVAPSHNIPQIQAEIETTKRLAETATDPAALQQLQEKQAILRGEIQKILESKTLIDRNGSPFVPPEWQKAANQIESQKTKAVKDADAYAAMEQDLRANQSAMPGVQQKFENLGKILTNYQTGKLENFKTFVPAIAQAVGIQVDPDKIKTREDFEKFVKESRDLLFQQLKQVGGRILVTEVQRMQEAVVDPELQPGANRSLIASGKAATNYTQDFYDHYRGWKRDNPYATVDDFADMQREWQTKNKLQKYITEAEANTPVRGDFPPPDKRKDGYQYIVDTPEVRNHVVDGKRVSPNGFIGRWNAREGKFIPEKVL